MNYQKIAYCIENMPLGGYVVTKVGTNGKTSRALSSLEETITFIQKIFSQPPDEPAEAVINPTPPMPSPTWEDVPIRYLELSCRAANCLTNAKIETVGKLANTPEAVLLRIPNFGRRSLREVREVVSIMRKTNGRDYFGRDIIEMLMIDRQDCAKWTEEKFKTLREVARSPESVEVH